MELNTTNQDNLWEIVVAVESNLQHLGLFLAVCDQDALRKTAIQQYEQELAAQGIICHRVSLNSDDPSLYRAVREGFEQIDNSDQPMMFSVEGGVGLSETVAANEEKSPLAKFLGYLQWTREAMREFEFPIVIWINGAVYDEIAREAPDFYSWRQGVFFFERQPILGVGQLEKAVIVQGEGQIIDDIDDDLNLSLPELLEYVAQREAKNQYDANLAKLYELVAKQYGKSLATYDEAVATWEKAIALNQQLGAKANEANNLISLGILIYNRSNFWEAKTLWQKSLDIAREIGDRRGEANSLGNLGIAYKNLGEYQRAIAFHQQHLDIAREIGDRQGEANSLGSLGNAYCSLGEYQRAIAFQQQHLDIAREIGDRRGEAASLGNLGNAYDSLGEYQRAISFYEQALSIYKEIGNKSGFAAGTYNIAIAWSRLGRKYEAQQNILAAKDLFEEMGAKHRVEDCEKLLREILQIVDAATVQPLWTPDTPASRQNSPAQYSFSDSPEQPTTKLAPLPPAFQIPAQKPRRSLLQNLWLKFKRLIRSLFR
ncbi:MAG: tetratricopeptide repeat protein [Limnothrix sp. RL_2_0]|nr:tetratricopeptide repeat protein [Limnothrix sp. RL_2_0]